MIAVRSLKKRGTICRDIGRRSFVSDATDPNQRMADERGGIGPSLNSTSCA